MAAKKSGKRKSKRTPWEKPAPRKSKHTTLTAGDKAKAKKRAKKAGRPYPNLVDNMTVAKQKRGRKKAAKGRKKAAKGGRRKASKGGRRKASKRHGGTTARRSASRRTNASATARRSASRRSSATASKRGSTSRRTSATTRRTASRGGVTARRSASRRVGRAQRTAATKDPRGGLTAAGRRAFARKDGSHLKPGVRKSTGQMSLEDMRRKGSWATRFYGRKELPPLVDAKGNPTRFALSAHAWGEPVPKTVAAARRIAAKGKQLLEKYERQKNAP